MHDPVGPEYRKVFETSTNLVLLIDRETLTVLHFNLPTLMQGFSASAGQLVQTRLDELLENDDSSLGELSPAKINGLEESLQQNGWQTGRLRTGLLPNAAVRYRAIAEEFYQRSAWIVEVEIESPAADAQRLNERNESDPLSPDVTGPEIRRPWLDEQQTLTPPAEGETAGARPAGRGDIPDRQAEIARLEFLAEQTPGLIFQTCGDQQGRGFFVPYINPAVYEYTGWTAAEIYNTPLRFLQTVHYEDWPKYCDRALQAMLNHVPFEIEMRIVSCRDGRATWMQVKSRPTMLQDGRQLWSGLALDISRLKAAETERREAHAELTTKFQQEQSRMSDLRTEKLRLQSALNRTSRTDVIREVTEGFAHEVHQPLSAISNYASGTLNRLQKETLDREQLGNVLEQIRKAAVDAADIVRRVRKFVNTRDRRVEWHPLGDIINDVVGLARPILEQHGIELELIECLYQAECFIDQAAMMQAILNLVYNSQDAILELPPEQRRIIIGWTVENETACVRIRDFGPGIEEDMRERMFDQFATSKDAGLGIGLPQARSVIEANRGTLKWIPTDGPGTTFEVRLPCREADQNA